jgi:predicted component of type VI protein secretion system
MAYVVVSVKGEEVGRWSLAGPVSIGRSAECNIAVRDILLSRRHCQIVPYRSGWVAQDLGSKNGTRCGGERVARRGLADGNELTMGKTTVRFHLGQLPEAHHPPVTRPADPVEALSNTVSAFDVTAADNYRRKTNQPHPRPEPLAPAAYAREDLYTLLSEIASSSWDSIYAQASQPRRPTPQIDLVLRQRVGATAGGTTGVVGRGGPATAGLPRRTRLGFAEELQARSGAGELPRRVVRPKTPLAADVAAVADAAAGEMALAGFTAFAGPVPAVRAAKRGPGLVRRSLRAAGSPFATVGRWLRGR